MPPLSVLDADRAPHPSPSGPPSPPRGEGYLARPGSLIIGDQQVDLSASRSLPGRHNAQNAAAATALGTDQPWWQAWLQWIAGLATGDVTITAHASALHRPMGETIKALVVLADGQEASEADLIAWCKDKAAGYKAPTSIEFRDELARTATGKLQKFKLRAPYWEGYDRQVN